MLSVKLIMDLPIIIIYLALKRLRYYLATGVLMKHYNLRFHNFTALRV